MRRVPSFAGSTATTALLRSASLYARITEYRRQSTNVTASAGASHAVSRGANLPGRPAVYPPSPRSFIESITSLWRYDIRYGDYPRRHYVHSTGFAPGTEQGVLKWREMSFHPA